MENQSRRKFIRNLSLATAAVGSASFLSFRQGKPLNQQGKLGIALVGLGYYSRDLLSPGLLQTEHCYLAGVVTGSPEKGKLWSEKYNVPQKSILRKIKISTWSISYFPTACTASM
jgi:glucose-fructose oxidoreductase